MNGKRKDGRGNKKVARSEIGLWTVGCFTVTHACHQKRRVFLCSFCELEATVKTENSRECTLNTGHKAQGTRRKSETVPVQVILALQCIQQSRHSPSSSQSCVVLSVQLSICRAVIPVHLLLKEHTSQHTQVVSCSFLLSCYIFSLPSASPLSLFPPSSSKSHARFTLCT